MMKKIMFGLIFGVVIYSAMIFYTGFNEIVEAVLSFEPFFIIPVILLFSLGVMLEFARWNYYLNRLKLDIDLKTSILIFFSGFATGILPAKSGELVRFYLLKKHKGINLKKTVPIHFVGNLTMFFIVLLFSLPILRIFNVNYLWIFSVMAALLVSVFLLQSRGLSGFVYNHLWRIRFIRQNLLKIEESFVSSRALTSSRVLPTGILLSLAYYLAWSFSFYLVLRGFGAEISIILAVSILSFSAIMGVVSMLPGGLGAVEGGIFALLIYSGLAENIAAVATILSRFMAFWLLVILGIISFLFLERSSEKT